MENLQVTTYLLWSGIGLLEWALALSRTLFTLRGSRILVPTTVFLEVFLAMIVFKSFIASDDWIIALSYSAGSALGSLLPMLLWKGERHGQGDKG